jgi:hypothetical protein
VSFRATSTTSSTTATSTSSEVLTHMLLEILFCLILAIPNEKLIRFAAIEFSMFFGIQRYDVIIHTTFSIYPVSILTLRP